MDEVEKVVNSLFYEEINALLRNTFAIISEGVTPKHEELLKERKFNNPLRIICNFENVSLGIRNKQWRLELDFDDYQWSCKTMKPHFLTALVSIEVGKEVLHFKYQLCSSFNEGLKPMYSQEIEQQKLNDEEFVIEKLKELTQFLKELPECFLQEIKKINFNELEYIMHPKIQEKWKQGYLPGIDGVIMGEGEIIIGNVYRCYDPNNGETKQFWFPLCDTIIESIEKYDDDIWVEVDVFHGAFEYENQKFVFGDGAMGNEGYIASTTMYGELNWAIFFKFSNPIHKAEVKDKHLICYGDSGTIIQINLNNITKIKIVSKEGN